MVEIEALAILAQLGKLVIAIIMAVISLYIAARIFDRLTGDLDELNEIRKGNLAVGVLMACVTLGVALLISGGLNALVATTDFTEFAKSFIWLIAAIILAAGAQFVAVSIFSALTAGIDEIKELKRGNVAVAVMLGALIVALSWLISIGLPRA